MAKITAHLVNAADGTHAGSIEVELIRVSADGRRSELNRQTSDVEGRFAMEVDLANAGKGDCYELVLATRSYFAARGQNPAGKIVVRDVVVRFEMPVAEDRYHFPIILAPNACSIWWAS